MILYMIEKLKKFSELYEGRNVLVPHSVMKEYEDYLAYTPLDMCKLKGSLTFMNRDIYCEEHNYADYKTKISS